MKKRFLLLLCALLALPVFASAEDVLTLSGAALNAAQTIAADDSLIITETITDEEGTSVTVLSHRLNDLRQEVFTLLDEDGTLTQLRPDYGFRLAPDSANPETLVMMPDVLAETRESLRGQLALFDDEETYLFVRQPGWHADRPSRAMRLTAKRSPKPIAFPPKRIRWSITPPKRPTKTARSKRIPCPFCATASILSTSFFQTRAKAKRSPFVWFPSTARKRPSRFR